MRVDKSFDSSQPQAPRRQATPSRAQVFPHTTEQPKYPQSAQQVQDSSHQAQFLQRRIEQLQRQLLQKDRENKSLRA